MCSGLCYYKESVVLDGLFTCVVWGGLPGRQCERGYFLTGTCHVCSSGRSTFVQRPRGISYQHGYMVLGMQYDS